MDDRERQGSVESWSPLTMPPTSSLLPALLTLAALIHPLALVLGRFDRRIDLLTHFSERARQCSLPG